MLDLFKSYLVMLGGEFFDFWFEELRLKKCEKCKHGHNG